MSVLHISFYVPAEYAEKVKSAMFSAGAGKIGNYDSCSFESEGIGQFRALPGSSPFIGKQDSLEKVRELKVEMVCEGAAIGPVIKAMKDTHPYETPAYYVIETLGI